jgi:purine-binding chemotaxis protein CheW
MSIESDDRQLVVFTLGGEHYALAVQQVQEIIRYTAPRSIASQTAWVLGVISLRGRLLPVYDLALRLGLARPEGSPVRDELSKIVIVECGSETAGVVVDGVEEVLTVDASAIEIAPTADTTVIQAIVRSDERLIALLALDTLLGVADVAPAQPTVSTPEAALAT